MISPYDGVAPLNFPPGLFFNHGKPCTNLMQFISVCENSKSDSYCNTWVDYCSRSPAFRKLCKMTCDVC